MSSALVGSLRINLEANSAQFGKDLRRAQGKMRRFMQTGRDAATVGAAFGGFSAALGGVARVAVRASTVLNAGMANVATLIPGATQRVHALKQSVRELSVAHGKDSQDLASGLYQTISAFGDRAGRTMEILRINSEAATAGVATTSEAIALTSAVTKAYGDTSAEAVRKASDLAFTTVRLGQTSFPELAAAIGRTTPIAAALGVKQEELAASYATLTGTLGSTSETSTALAAVLGELLEPRTEAMRAAVEDLGVADGKTLIKTRGLKGAIDALIGTTDGSEASIAELFSSQESLLAVLPLVGAASEKFTANLREMQSASGATDEAFREQTGGVNEAGHAWDLLLARVRSAMGELGDVLIPILLRAAETLRPVAARGLELVAAFGRLSQPVQTVGVAFAALVPILSLATIAISTVLLHAGGLITRLGASTTFVANLVRSLIGLPPAGDAAARTLAKVPPAAGRTGVAVRMLTIGIRGLWAALWPAGLVLALGAAVTWLVKFWRAAQEPGPKLERLKSQLADVTERLDAMGGKVSASATRLQRRKRALEEQIDATRRLAVETSDFGRTLEALAARDMAAWNEQSAEAGRRARELAGDLPETTQRLDEMVRAVRHFAAEGRLTPAVMQEIARQAQALGVEAADLPPELCNIVEGLGRVNPALADLLGRFRRLSAAEGGIAPAALQEIARQVRALGVEAARLPAALLGAIHGLDLLDDVEVEVPIKFRLPEGSVEAAPAAGVIGPIEIPTTNLGGWVTGQLGGMLSG